MSRRRLRLNAAMVDSLAVRLLRVAVAALVVSAEIYLIVRLGEDFTPSNHFSYFTVLSNVFAAVVLAIGVVRPAPDAVRGAAVLYMTVTGVVYAVLLRGVDVDTPAYANWILHVVVPLLVIVDWLLAPPRGALGVRQTATWLAFPVAYLVYTLLRGPIVDWYPYPFLDPGEDGYGAVAVSSVFVAVVVAVLAAAVVVVGNWRRAQSSSVRFCG